MKEVLPTLPKVSILVPSYNHSAYIADVIKSIWAQDYPHLQLIVVDDGSTDGSFEIINQLASISPIEMVAVHQPNQGICPTLNHALCLATGELIGVLASDDLMMPNRLLREGVQFSMYQDLKVLYSNGCFQYKNKTYGDVHQAIKVNLKQGIASTLSTLLTQAPAFYIQAMLIKKDFLLAIGGFDEETGSDDWALHIRIFKALKSSAEYLFFENNAFMYRLHEKQNHRDGEFMSPMKRRVVRKYFSLEGRAHYFCDEYLKHAVRSFLSGDFKKSKHYAKKVISVGFINGTPWACMTEKMLKMPSFLIRNYFFKFRNVL